MESQDKFQFPGNRSKWKHQGERVKHDFSSHTYKHSRERFTTIENEKETVRRGFGKLVQPRVANTDLPEKRRVSSRKFFIWYANGHTSTSKESWYLDLCPAPSGQSAAHAKPTTYVHVPPLEVLIRLWDRQQTLQQTLDFRLRGPASRDLFCLHRAKLYWAVAYRSKSHTKKDDHQ